LTEGDETTTSRTPLRDYSSVTAEMVRADLESGLADVNARIAALVAEPQGDAFVAVALLDGVEADVIALHGRAAFLGLVHPDGSVRIAAGEARVRIARWRAGLLLRDGVADLR
jgi:hypothetical protein